MLKNFQKYLLLHYPLLWNLKIVPITTALILLNIAFFIIGIANGTVNFKDNETDFRGDDDALVIFFAVLIGILSLIVWLIYYFKNNAFKSFYPKNKFSLCKEWLLLFAISFLLCLFIASYYFGKDVRVRSYFSENEAKKRCDILSTGSFFINGSYTYYPEDSNETIATPEIAYDTIKQKDLFFIYKGKKYKTTSLVNKGINSYSFFNFEQDSIRKEKIKTWLITDDKTAIKKALKKYLQLAKEHNLKSSIDENKWFELIYDYPNYENYKLIAAQEKEYYGNYTDYQGKPTYDTTSQYLKEINNEKYVYNKFFVPEAELKHNYSKIANAWANPTVNANYILITLYFALGLSILIFSFRVTSGKSWLINFVVLGVLNLLFGILSILFSSQYTYTLLLLSVIIIAFSYFIIITQKKESKSISAILLNTFLWTFPSFLPIIYYIVLQYIKDIDNYNYSIISQVSKYRKIINFMEDNLSGFFWINLLFVIITLVYISIKIKHWKGIAEE